MVVVWWCFSGGLMGGLDVHVPSNVMQIYLYIYISKNLIRNQTYHKKRLPNSKKLSSKGETF